MSELYGAVAEALSEDLPIVAQQVLVSCACAPGPLGDSRRARLTRAEGDHVLLTFDLRACVAVVSLGDADVLDGLQADGEGVGRPADLSEHR